MLRISQESKLKYQERSLFSPPYLSHGPPIGMVVVRLSVRPERMYPG